MLLSWETWITDSTLLMMTWLWMKIIFKMPIRWLIAWISSPFPGKDQVWKTLTKKNILAILNTPLNSSQLTREILKIINTLIKKIRLPLIVIEFFSKIIQLMTFKFINMTALKISLDLTTDRYFCN
jgi:hypothetical protein